jgi:hypothetical protein
LQRHPSSKSQTKKTNPTNAPLTNQLRAHCKETRIQQITHQENQVIRKNKTLTVYPDNQSRSRVHCRDTHPENHTPQKPIQQMFASQINRVHIAERHHTSRKSHTKKTNPTNVCLTNQANSDKLKDASNPEHNSKAMH